MSFVACTIFFGNFTLAEVLKAVLSISVSVAEFISYSKDSMA